MQGFVDQLQAMKTVFWQGAAVADVIDWDTRQNAQREILDRAGVAKTMAIEVNDPYAAMLQAIAERLKADE